MDQPLFYTITIICTTISLFIYYFLLTKSQHKNHPPSPTQLPIIGHLHLIKQPLHRFLQDLSITYGSIYNLKLGFRSVTVVSSPEIVEECFTKHDIVLANRPRLLVGKHLHYGWTTLGAANYGPLWRNLLRITTLEFISAMKLNLLSYIRLDEVRLLAKDLFVRGRNGFVEVDMRPKFSKLSFNIVMRMVTGKRYFGPEAEEDEEAKVFRGIASDTSELSGASNPVDLFPFIRWFGMSKVEKKMLDIREKMDVILDRLIEECRNNNKFEGALENKAPMIYKLLELQESDPDNYSDQIIKGIISIMLTAGTDTSSVTMEWALSLLLNHHDILEKARLEIDTKIGIDRLVDENDLNNLPYIQNIIKETLRLYPSVPLLSPHEPSEDCTIAGYYVPKGTMVLINAWAIHRDPSSWEDPLCFRPERFEDKNENEYKLILVPFGRGRRACSGAPLPYKVVGLTLATLIQCFDWEKIGHQKLDLVEGFGLSMPKATPLKAMCKVRRNVQHIFDQSLL